MFAELGKLSKRQFFASNYSSSAPSPTAEEGDAHRHYIRALAYTGKELKDETRAESPGAASINPIDAWFRYFLKAAGG